jgi:transcriptional regulator with XRE-family HTH domain
MRESEVKIIIQALRYIQAEKGLSLTGLAHTLGYSVGQVSMIFAGKRRPGLKFVCAVYERFPEVEELVAESLSFFEQNNNIPH